MRWMMFCALAATLGWAAPLLADENVKNIEPLALPDGASTDADFQRGKRAFYQRDVALYLEHTQDSEAVRAPATAFLKSAIDQLVEDESFNSPEPDWRPLANDALALIKLGTKDPLLLSYCGAVLMEDGQPLKVKPHFDAVLAQFKTSSYPRWALFPILCRWHWLATRLHGRFSEPARKELIAAAPAWLEHAAEVPDDRRHIWALYSKVEDEEEGIKAADERTIIAAWQSQADKDPWLWEIVQAHSAVSTAWSYRGSDSASEVEEAGWKKFGEYMPRAGEHYRKAYELHPECPEGARGMITVAMTGHDGDSPREWFERSIAGQCDYVPAYDSLLWSLRPRWGGSHEAMIEFGEQCARTGRYDTAIPFMFVTALWSIRSEDFRGWKKLLDEPRVYDKLAYVLNEMADHPANVVAGEKLSARQASLLTSLLLIAVEGERPADVCDIADRLGDQVNDLVYRRTGSNVKSDICRMHAYREFPTEMKEVIELFLEPRTTPEQVTKILDRWTAIRQLSQDPQAQQYLDARIELMKMELAYHRGEWVDLAFDPAMSHWMGPETASWKCEDRHTASASNMERVSWLALYHLGQFPGPREIQCEVQVLEFLNPFLRVGCFFGMPRTGQTGFYVNPAYNFVGIQTPKHPTYYFNWDRLPKVNKLHARLWRSAKAEFFVNDRMLSSNAPEDDAMNLPPDDNDENRVGIGSGNLLSLSLRVRNVRVRKLTVPPPPEYGDFQERYDYFTQAIERDPQLTDYYRPRGHALYFLKRYDEAIEDLEKYVAFRPEDYRSQTILATCYRFKGRYSEAMGHFEAANKVAAKFLKRGEYLEPATLAYNLAAVPIDELRDGPRALAIAEELCKLSKNKNFNCLEALAVAQAEVGKFDEAIRSLELAEKVADSESRRKEVAKLKEKFAAGEPARLTVGEDDSEP